MDIIGAGISGLATAYYLSQQDPSIAIRVWEKAATPGGLAGTFRTEHFSVEKFYHHIYKRDTHLQQLIHELGVGHLLEWRPAATGAYHFLQPFRLSSPLDLLKFKPLPFLDRLRMGALVLHARTIRDWKALDDISAKSYILRYGGKRVYEVVWEPLFRGKFGGHADDVSAAWLWSKLVDRGGSRSRSGVETLGYLRGGLGVLFDALVGRLQAAGHQTNFGTAITRIEGSESGFVTAIHADGQRIESDIVVCCTQVPDLVALLPSRWSAYREALGKISFLANVCLVLTLRESLSAFYWTNVTDPSAPFVGIIEQTKWADRDIFGGKHVAYISAYVPPEDERLHMSPESLLSYYAPFLKKMFPDFDQRVVEAATVWTARYTQPIVHVGYRHHVPAIQSPIDNLFVCTMAQIYPHDRQVSNGVQMARDTVDTILRKHRS